MIYTIIASALTTLLIIFGSYSLPIQKNEQPLGAFQPISVPAGGTGWATVTPNTVLLGNGSSRLATTTQGTAGQVLMLSNGVPGWYATSTSAGSGITTLGSQTGSTQTFSGIGAGNATTSVTSAGDNHQIVLVMESSPNYTNVIATGTVNAVTLQSDTLKANSSAGVAVQTVNGIPFMSLGAGPGVDGSINGNWSVGLNNANYVAISGAQRGSAITFQGSGTDDNSSFYFGLKGNGVFGVATSTASTTLSVQGGGLFSGNVSMAGLRATGTAYIATAAGQQVGIGTTSVASNFVLGVHGASLLAGSTTVSGLLATSSIEAVQLRISGSASSTFVGGLISTNLILSNGLAITGGSITNTSTATSTFSGGLALPSLSSSGGLKITAGSLTNTGSATSSFAGYLTTGGLTSSNGLVITGGSLLNTSTATSTWSGGLTLTGLTSTGHGLFAGKVGIGGTTTPAAHLAVVGSAYAKEVVDTYGSSMTIDWGIGNQHKVILTGATTLTFANGRDGGAYRLVACQDSTGGRVITWPATTTLSWAGRTGPSVAAKIADHCDAFSFIGTSATSSFMYFGVEALSF